MNYGRVLQVGTSKVYWHLQLWYQKTHQNLGNSHNLSCSESGSIMWLQ